MREARCCNAKYTDALRNLLPWRPTPKDPRYLPGPTSGLFSCTSLSWMTGLMYRTRNGLKKEDMWKLQEVDGAELNYERLQRLWEEEQQKAGQQDREPYLKNAVTVSIKTRTIVTIVLSLVYTALMFLLTSHIMHMTLNYVSAPEVDLWQAGFVISLVVSLNLIRAYMFNAMFIVAIHTAMRTVGALQAMVFHKVLRLQYGGEDLSGHVANIINNDMERIMEAVISIVFLASLPLTTVAALVYAWYIVGAWCLIGYVAIFLILPIINYMQKMIGHIRAKVCKVSDSRVSLMTEILTNIRLIKMYSWEDSFAKNIEKLRSEEVSHVRGIGLLQAVNLTLSPVMSSIALLTIMVAITLSGESISASTAFTLASVLNSFQYSLGTVPFMLRSIAEARVAMDRLQAIMMRKEHKSHGFSVIQNSLAINIQHASFQWSTITTPPAAAADAAENKDKNAQKSQKKKTSNSENKDVVKSELNKKESNCKDAENNSLSEASSESQPAAAVPKQQLRGVNLSIPKGTLLGICGGVGAGKSSLLSAICGDMLLVSGDVQVNGRVALVSQQAWIYNDSLRDNLLMGKPYNKERYDRMIEACALKTDLQILPDADNTEIGEKGINLSGGQKQRVSLGRAVYSNHEILLLDDPLSAVDTMVARHIFQHCITGCLKGKTVLLVTHALHFLEQCDEVVLVKNGEIVERGPHSELMSRDGAYAEFLSYDKTGQQQPTAQEEQTVSSNNNEQKPEPEKQPQQQQQQKQQQQKELTSNKDGVGKLISQEKRESGGVKSSVYRYYMQASGGWLAAVVLLLSMFLYTAIRIFSVIWQQWWLDAGDGLMQERLANQSLWNSTDLMSDEQLRGDISQHPDLYVFQGVHFGLFLAVIITGLLKGYVAIYTLTKGSRRLHNTMFKSILRAPTSFFDVTPTSRIITRFSKDIDEMDYRIPTFFDMLVQSIFFITASALLVCFFFPYFSIVLVIVGVVFAVLGRMLGNGVKEFKRLESTQKSPVVQSIVSCISGLHVIRAYGQQNQFAKRFYEVVDDHTVVMLVFRLSNRWYTFRMDLLAIVIVGSITALCVLTKGAFSTAIAGLALTSVNGMCQFLPFLMRIKSEFESRMTSVERILEYAFNIESEAPRDVKGVIPEGETWPSKGALLLKDVCLRYRPNLPLVLRNISADIAPGERVGIVGRTGAGKSSLVTALLRIVELDSGSIEIDGIDISKLGLHTLRSALSVIPQDPVLFHGTIRYNLDPFEEHSDDSVTAAAQKARLWSVLEKLPLGLSALVEAGGQNFSVGERQLICLTRAVLRNSKVLLLDEATASVDPETDQLIQAALQTAFTDATLLTVAHRLNTIVHYDRIMVMEEGEIREFGSPVELFEKDGSLFRQMLAAIGITTKQQLLALS
uniref:ATP-binding cassette transporter sub-family C member 5 n=1 Tax=Hirondellea gigas TaxID=1518452 RepID=A0A6A7FUX9_9CRUS